MNPTLRRVLSGTLAAAAGLVVLALAFGALIDAGVLNGLVIRAVEASSSRSLRITGPLSVTVLSLHPQLRATGVEIDNPPWTARGSTGHIGTLGLTIDFPWFGRPFTIETLDIDSADLHLTRDLDDRANWQWSDPRVERRHGLPLMHALRIRATHLLLDDEKRHLHFDGEVSASSAAPAAAPAPLRLEAHGRMNGRATSLDLTGDPLATARQDRPYRFHATARSGASVLEAEGSLAQPLYFDSADGSFSSTGGDLDDLYYLAGVKLIHTGPYHLSAQFSRRGWHSSITRLEATSGESDMGADIEIDASPSRSRLDVNLASHRLRIADLGPHAKSDEDTPPGQPQQASPAPLSSAPIGLDGLRRHDGVYRFHAERLEAARVTLSAVDARVTLASGLLEAAPITAQMLGGTLTASGSFDARRDIPSARISIALDDIHLAELGTKGASPPPLDARLRAHVALAGTGPSLEALAASATGTAGFVVPGGFMRASLAELIGVDLRGLGLMLAGSTAQTPIRCGVGELRARQGVLTADTLVLDTDRVLITGEGRIDLGTESLDLVLRGYPKGLRILKLRTPIKVAGTLAHPAFSLDTRQAKLELIDAGRTKDADCAALRARVAADIGLSEPES